VLKRPAFFLDVQRCTGCKTCMIACRDKHNLPPDVRWRRVVEFVGGAWKIQPDGTYFQDVFAYYLSISCNHCRNPVCVAACPTTAMHQDEFGIVRVDPDKCVGCRYCEWVCPYSAPQFDAVSGSMTKCDFCRDDLLEGGVPACVAACPTRALQFGEYDQLAAEPGIVHNMAPLPPDDLTEPGFVLAAHRDVCPAKTCRGRIANPEEVIDVE